MRRRLAYLLLGLPALVWLTVAVAAWHGYGQGYGLEGGGARPRRLFYSASTSDVDSFQAATARSCWDSTTGTLVDIPIDGQCCDDGWCFYSPVVIQRIANGTYRGVLGGVPTSWTDATGQRVTAGGVHGATSGCFTETAAAANTTFQNLGPNAGIRNITMWAKYTAAPDLGRNILMGLADAPNTQWLWTVLVGHSTWTKITSTESPTGVGNFYPQFGTQALGTNMVTTGTYCADAMSVVRDISYAPRYCDGAVAGTVCAAELASYAFTATELPATRARIRVRGGDRSVELDGRRPDGPVGGLGPRGRRRDPARGDPARWLPRDPVGGRDLDQLGRR